MNRTHSEEIAAAIIGERLGVCIEHDCSPAEYYRFGYPELGCSLEREHEREVELFSADIASIIDKVRDAYGTAKYVSNEKAHMYLDEAYVALINVQASLGHV